MMDRLLRRRRARQTEGSGWGEGSCWRRCCPWCLPRCRRRPLWRSSRGTGPPPPEYQVKEDGTLIVGGDIEVHCSQVGLDEQYLTASGPQARACEAAGFEIAGDGTPSGASTPAASASGLPETGGSGPAVVAFVPLALLVGGLLAFGVVRRNLL